MRSMMGSPTMQENPFPLVRAQKPLNIYRLRRAGGKGPDNRVITQQSTRIQGKVKTEGGSTDS